MRPEDINKMQPEDRFHVHGFRIIIPRRDWPRGLRWLQRLVEHWNPPIPPGSSFTMTVNGRAILKIPIPDWQNGALGSLGTRPFVLSPTDQFECAVNFPRPRRMPPGLVRVMVDGYFVRGLDRIADTIVAASNPGGT